MHANLSFNGLLAGYPELFDDLKVPDSVSKDTVCNQLLFETLELEVLYADGPTMRRAMGVYSETMLPSWTRYAEALGLKYDALASDDRTRTTDHSGTSIGTNGVKGTTTRVPNLTTTGQNNGSDSTTRDVTGFDSGTLQTAERSTTAHGYDHHRSDNHLGVARRLQRHRDREWPGRARPARPYCKRVGPCNGKCSS